MMLKRYLLILVTGLFLCADGRGQSVFKEVPAFVSFTDSNSYKAAITFISDNAEDKTEDCLSIALQLLNRKELDPFRYQKALLYKNTGVLYDYKGNLDSTLFYLNKARVLFRDMKNELEESHVVNNIAIAYYLRGIYELAVKHHLEALGLRQKTGSQKHIAQSYNNLGLLYRAKKDYNSAVEMYNKSLQLKTEARDSSGILNTLINLGACYSSWGKFDSSLAYASRSEELARQLHLVDDIIGSKANKASALVNLGKTQEGSNLAMEVLRYEPSDTKTLLTVYETLSDARLQQQAFREALGFTEKGFDLANHTNRLEQKAVFLRNLSVIYEKLNKNREALHFLQQHQQLTDSLYKEENSRQINEMAAVYNNNQKETLIGQLNESLTVKELSAENRRKERNIFITASIVFLLLCLLLLKAYRQIRKNKNELTQKNNLIESSLREKEALMKEIHHRVKNNLQLISSLLNMQTDFIGDEKALDAITESKNRVMSMALLHQNLYQQNDITAVNLQLYTRQLCENLLRTYEVPGKPVALTVEAPDLAVDVDQLVPVGLIINELITNAVKYAFRENEQSQLGVLIRQEKSDFRLIVEDNGPGFPIEQLNNSSSFGYKIIQAFLKKLKGRLHTTKDPLFRIHIQIPDFFNSHTA